MDEAPKLRETDPLPETRRAAEQASEHRIDRQCAVVVGIGAYADFNRLDNAPPDATAIADLLRDDFSFAQHPTAGPLLDGAATHEAITQAVKTSLAQATATTRWLFYFAGHGRAEEGGEAYLLPIDVRRGDRSKYLTMPWLLGQCRNSACGEALIILDTCYGGRALVRPEALSDLIPDQGQSDRALQLIASGNPDQPVLDSGGSGHSVFTQSLLDALEGWAGIHDPDGAIRFAALLDHLVFEVPGRLRALGMSAALQQPIGGNLIGNRTGRGVTLRSANPRLDPAIVRDSRSDDPSRRRDGLARLEEVRQEHHPLAVELVLRHLRRQEAQEGPLLSRTLHYEPVVEVRARAASTLGTLGDGRAVEALVAALDDEPVVCLAAADALGRLRDPHAAAPLIARLRHADDELFLGLVGAIGAIDEQAAILAALGEALRRKRLVPFVGPDFPQALTGLPDRAAVTRELARRAGVAGSESLAAAAAATMRGTRYKHTYTDFLMRALDHSLPRPGVIHRALADLGAQFWISGAYDAFLPRALGANAIVSGSDTQYWQPDRPTVVRLTGDLARPDSLLVIEDDFARLRESEGDRRLLISYLLGELNGKVVLFLGYDPSNPDFALLVDYVLNQHLSQAQVRAFLVWPEARPLHAWGTHPIHVVVREPIEVVRQLRAAVGG